MIFDYALHIMVVVFFLNLRGDGRNVAGIFLLVSIFFDTIISFSSFVESYVIYAFGELILIQLLFFSNGPDRLVRDMIRLSTLSISIQLIGALMWMNYYEPDFYIALCQMAFVLQIIRLTAHGVITGKALYSRGGTLDSVHTRNSDKNL